MKRLWCLLVPVFVIGCAETGPGTAPDAGPTTQDAGHTLAPDAGQVITFGPTAPPVELTPEPLPFWYLGVVTEAVRAEFNDEDPILDRLRQGNLPCPSVGIDEDGVRWRPIVLPESGEIETPRSAGTGVLYLIACIDSDAPRGLIAQADGINSVFVNGAEQPGDIYRTGRYRLPAPLQAGSNQIVLRASTDTQRGLPRARLWRTPDELAFNDQDMTFADLVVGDSEPQFLGLPVLNLGPKAVLQVRTQVLENEFFETASREYVALTGGAVTQLGFELRLKAPLTLTATTAPVKVQLLVQAPDLEWSYAHEVELKVVPPGTAYRASFISDIDRSVQYYGVAPPPAVQPGQAYATILSLHGAGVQAIGQARAYGLKDWAYLLAATNRRPFGFDWEDWGRLDALEVLAEGQRRFTTDPTQVYLTGHSMGGHGTWNVGVTHPGLFALMGPSAGWSHFDAYGGARSPAPGPGIAGAFAAAQQHSQTLDFLDNLSRRAVFIIHGDADNNVPVSFARNMRSALEDICEDLHYHEEPGAGHWWDGYPEPGAQCVDWPDMMALMQQRRLDPTELDFSFKTAGPWVNERHSFLDVLAAEDPYSAVQVQSMRQGERVVITSSNAASLALNGAALLEKGITEIVVDGESRTVTQQDLQFGSATAKHPGQYGPLKQAFFKPWLFVYDEAGPDAYRALAAYYTTFWSFIGNGYSPALPLSALTQAHRDEHNIIYLGLGPQAFLDDALAPVQIMGAQLGVQDDRFEDAAAVFVFPEGQRLSAAFYATPGSEHLLYALVPFRSGFGLPDYLIYSEGGTRTAGFADANWQVTSELRR